MNRPQDGRRSTLPTITSLAERVRGGETLDAIAQQYGVTVGRLQERFSLAGFSITGVSINRAKGVDLKNYLATALKSWREPWMDGASCASVDPELWFPENGRNPKDARKICARCPVAAQCREYALTNNERFGIWGNTSERDRRKILKGAAA